MSYYIAPRSDDTVEIGELIIYRVVKRLSDFKPVEGQLYRVFKSKKEMHTNELVTCYRGINGKLKKCNTEFLLRF